MLTTGEQWACDLCGYAWSRKEGVVPDQCRNRKCRSRKWNSLSGDSPPPKPGSPPKPRRKKKVGPVVPAPVPVAVEPEPFYSAPGPCPYREYDPESGDWYGCRLPAHAPTIKHQRGELIG